MAGYYKCDSISAGRNCVAWGLNAEGGPVFEAPDDVLFREKIMKKIAQTCGCKTVCFQPRREGSKSRCSYRKAIPTLLCTIYNYSGNCTNRRKMVDGEIFIPVGGHESGEQQCQADIDGGIDSDG